MKLFGGRVLGGKEGGRGFEGSVSVWNKLGRGGRTGERKLEGTFELEFFVFRVGSGGDWLGVRWG